MKLPYLDAPEQSVDMITQFGGLNRKLTASGNEFSNMKNMTALQFPMAATRENRGKILINGRTEPIEGAIGIHSKDKLLVTYTQKGESGISFAEGLAAADVDGILQNDGQWTSAIMCGDYYICDNLTYGMKRNSLHEEYKYIYYCEDEKPAIPFEFHSKSNNTVYVKWPHESFDATFFLYRKLGTVKSITTTSDATVIEIDSAAASDSEFFNIFRAGIRIGTSRDYSENKGEISIIQGGSVTVWIYSEIQDIAVGDPVYGRGFFIDSEPSLAAKNDSDLYSTAILTSPSAEDAIRLSNQTIDCNGNKISVVSITADHDVYTAKIARPHGEIPAGWKVLEDRLYLAELNPETGDMIATNICAAASGKRHIVEMGAYIVFFPEKVMVNTAERSLSGEFTSVESLEFSNTMYGDKSYKYRLCDVNGNFYNAGSMNNTAPQNLEDGYAWLDSTSSPPSLKVWSAQTNSWATIQPYVQFYAEDISDVWQKGDAVEMCFGENGGGEYISPKEGQKYFVISETGTMDDGRRFIRIPVAPITTSEVYGKPGDKITFRRTVPDMDFVVESENRLWGCKYGVVNGEMINEIFACKLGDPKNWHYFANTALDSYYASLGADGEFTGAVTYNGNPFFFREDCLHRVYGNYPANYSVKTYACHGVEKGSENSLIIMNDVLFYNSPSGVMAYAGSAPVKISDSLGEDKLFDAVSGVFNNSLYLSAKSRRTDERKLYVFNDYYKLWHVEDSLNVKSLATYDNEIFALTTDGYIHSLSGVYGEKEKSFDWSFETACIGFSSPFRKFVFKITARLLMSLQTSASISIQYDSSGVWEHVAMIAPQGKTGSVSIPVKPHRCDHFALRFAGKGACKLLSLTKYTEEGSDI